MDHFKGKVAVVTGAASGIGRAIAHRCAAEGMKLVLAGINEDKLRIVERELKELGAAVLSVRTDVSKADDVQALADRALDAYGAAHLLVNNAGVGGGSTVWGSTLNDWEWTLGVNLWGVIYGCKTFMPIMLAQNDDCHIVNTSSIAGMVAYHPIAPYQVSKHAVVALSENLQLSLEAQQARIKVSVLCPGWVKTGILDSNRNRPIDLQNPAVTPTPEQIAAWNAAKEKLEAGMLPEAVAGEVFNAIRQNQFYIYTHPEYTPAIESRMADALNAANPRYPF